MKHNWKVDYVCRTPIHGILGLTALLLESELTPDQKESLFSVKECADLLLHIINSVLDLAKIEAGRLEVEKVPFNIRKMVSSTFRMMQARAHAHGLQLLWEVDTGVPQSLVGDVGKLQQCLLNLGQCTHYCYTSYFDYFICRLVDEIYQIFIVFELS
jgi:signal transduction histidine kinase